MSSIILEVSRGEIASSPGQAHRYENYRIVPARYPLRIAGTVFAVIVIALVLFSVFSNEKWGWPVFAEWFFSEPVLAGLGRTLLLTALATVSGCILGTLLALARVSKSPLLAALSWCYIWLLRSAPLIVLLLILNNLGYLYESIKIANPLNGEVWVDYPMVMLLTPFTAALIGLTLNQSAFFAEVVRGGILSVDQGQHEAAAALGLPKKRQALRIVLPQAMRSILPAAFNDIIGLAKGTSILYVLALPELFYTVQVIYRRTHDVIPLLMVATVWYLIIMSALSIIQHYIERHYARGALRNPVPLPFARLFSRLSGKRRANIRAQAERSSTQARNTAARLRPHPSAHRGFADIQAGRGASVHIHGVSKYYGSHQVLDHVNLHVPSGHVCAILGPSGSGKSTLLRTINHLERVDGGFIDIDGELVGYRRSGDTLYELKERDILKQRADIAMVFQNFNLFPHMSVLENIIEAPIEVKQIPYQQAVNTAYDLLERVGLLDKAHSYPRQLSGGQQQRVAIARALALKPKVLLFDEPTSALDPELVGEVLDVIKELAASGATMIVVTHEINFAREIADTVVFMEDGKILEKGPPEAVFKHTSHPRTRAFLDKVL